MGTTSSFTSCCSLRANRRHIIPCKAKGDESWDVITVTKLEALRMAEGAPPPWLFNMQRCGPPPPYPRLKIPGLNVPILPGASFGYILEVEASLLSMNLRFESNQRYMPKVITNYHDDELCG
ncbi:hypothetical protein Vadar_007722 [Vaccinium darrowii]|uniref:Uncharacterized protein n=1 Tax=Vaccinium darrowii TaxID=229202 RepID=A0ACB7YM21_9ERIC|nr:hypothetical protein Vadar_007722 [Vaccinium darrowii]